MAEKPPEKTPAEIKAEQDLMMARAAIKIALMCFSKKKQEEAPLELQNFWNSLDVKAWQEHLALFSKELKKYHQPQVKEIILDLDNYLKDCRKLVPNFDRDRDEIMLMVAIGQIKVDEFLGILGPVSSNRERLDRKIEKQIRYLDWQDDQDLRNLDELTSRLDNPRIKKAEIESIDKEISNIESKIRGRKAKRDELAIKLVEWKTRGTIDIAGGDKDFKLEA